MVQVTAIRRARPRLVPARLRAGDLLRLGGTGLRTRPLRVVLSSLGIAIGIAAMVAVVGISYSSQASLERALAAMGTNMLSVTPGTSIFGDPVTLPDDAVDMIKRIAPVTAASATGTVPEKTIYRTEHIPVAETGGLALLAAQTDLPATVGATIAEGSWLNAATDRYPVVVLGAQAAKQLGDVPTVYIDGRRYDVVGVLNPVALAPELDSAVLIGWPAAKSYLGFDGHATTIYTRSVESQVGNVHRVLAATTNPERPEAVNVTVPSPILKAKEATKQSFNSLLLGLGAVALLVGGIGVANTMVISVLERRAEIGLRRSLGATRGQIRVQFVTESLLLSLLGGSGGVLAGFAVTAIYATIQNWPVVVPIWAIAGGVGATLIIGAVAGLYPAIRAARLAPTEALATP
jgi:putative ABC transport system permease protein